MIDKTNTSLGGAPGVATTIDGQTRATRDVADLVRHCSQLDERHGFRVVARGASGHIFFDRGRVIHAEFGEDCGLRAVVEMLRAGPVRIEKATSWPSQPSLHLGPELLLSMAGKDASRVVRKVDLPVEPPPLPDPEASDELVASVHQDASRTDGRRAISGVMPRVVGPQARWAPGREGRSELPSEVPASELRRRNDAPASRGGRISPNPPGSPSSSVGVAPAPSPSRASSPRSSTVPALQAPPLPAPPPPLAAFAAQRPPSELPITRAQKARSRSVVVARAAKAAVAKAEAAQPVAKSFDSKSPDANSLDSKSLDSKSLGNKSLGNKSPDSKSPDSKSPDSKSRAAASRQQPTTMVRIASRGDLLAARGKDAEQLAEAAAFIHGLANLIAADFGRQGRANVHLSGGGMSLLVARSEVNDIAAALGPSERLASLLNKVGFK